MIHQHGSEGLHQHGPGESHDHARESFEAHGHFHEQDLEALMAHDTSIDAIAPEAANPGWMVLNSVGIDIGSSTSHLTFSRLYLERQGLGMSSRFVTVRREVLYRSPVLLTPYVDAESIDLQRLSTFVLDAYREAGLERARIHTGAVICTGEAVKKQNSEAITRLFSQMGGTFVCATAGPRLEAILAAHGSGSVTRSREGKTVLNIDSGGGTTKLSISRNGTILETGAVNVGARLLAWDPQTGRLNRIEKVGRQIAETIGIQPRLGQTLSPEQQRRFAETLVDLLVQYIRGERQSGLISSLSITGAFRWAEPIDEIIFSGGVGEYVYGHDRLDYGDFGPQMAAELQRRLGELPAPVVEGIESIRATVIGASQYTVQVSSSTIFVSDPVSLPLRDYQVVVPHFTGQESDDTEVASLINEAMAQYDRLDEATRHPVALYLSWPRETSYANLCLLASGIAQALTPCAAAQPWALIFEHDIGALVGSILKEDMEVPNQVVAVDEIDLTDLDFIDVGAPLGPRAAVPVVVKSLVFE